MIIKRKPHRVPGLNTTSTADISFMLLIFFLVTTSMNVDKGLFRQLPPAQHQPPTATAVDKNRLMVLDLGADGRLSVDGKTARMEDMRGRLAEFISKASATHIIKLHSDPNTKYEAYFQLQNQIAGAYRDVRNRLAMSHYGRKLKQCSDEQRQTVMQLCPQRIVEDYGTQEGGRP